MKRNRKLMIFLGAVFACSDLDLSCHNSNKKIQEEMNLLVSQINSNLPPEIQVMIQESPNGFYGSSQGAGTQRDRTGDYIPVSVHISSERDAIFTVFRELGIPDGEKSPSEPILYSGNHAFEAAGAMKSFYEEERNYPPREFSWWH